MHVTKSVTLCDHPHDAFPQDDHQDRERPETTRRQAKLAALNTCSVGYGSSWHTDDQASWTEKKAERSDEGKQLRLFMVWLHQDQTYQTKPCQTKPDRARQKKAGSIWLPAPEVCREVVQMMPDSARISLCLQ